MTTSVAHNAPRLIKPNPGLPAFIALSPTTIAIRAGVSFGGFHFAEETPIERMAGLTAGRDYEIVLDAAGVPATIFYGEAKAEETVLGGFHFAPGGNAEGREGGNSVPAINPYSISDLNFRPACLDPSGMALVAGSRGGVGVPAFWADIYLCAQDHLVGTSRHGATIADGYKNLPVALPGTEAFEKLDYASAVAILAHHGKQVMSLGEFFAAAYGVTEKTAAGSRVETTGLDAARTSAFGLMQATGQRYVWGHDGDPDAPRASFFGGGWDGGDSAGSRCADVDYWPDYSSGWLGARGRSDHLQLD